MEEAEAAAAGVVAAAVEGAVVPKPILRNKIMSLGKLSNLGVGIGFREPFRADLFLHQTEIDFLEITADHYFDANPRKLEELKLLKQHFPLVPHGQHHPAVGPR